MSKNNAPVKLVRVVVSVRHTTKLTLAVPQGIDEETICKIVTTCWNGDHHFLDDHFQPMPESNSIILESEGIENDTLIESSAEPLTETVAINDVVDTWRALTANADTEAIQLPQHSESGGMQV